MQQPKGVSMGIFGDILGPIVSAYSNHREAEMQREWQDDQRKTAYQDTVADLNAAGLSPMLAYSKGPTSGGTGATAAPMQQLRLGETEQREAETEASRGQADVAKSTVLVNAASADKLKAEADNVRQDTENKKLYPGMNTAQIQQLNALTGQHGATAAQLTELVKNLIQERKLREPEEKFKAEHPTYSKYASPVMDALRTIFGGVGLLRGTSALPNVVKMAPKGKQ